MVDSAKCDFTTKRGDFVNILIGIFPSLSYNYLKIKPCVQKPAMTSQQVCPLPVWFMVLLLNLRTVQSQSWFIIASKSERRSTILKGNLGRLNSKPETIKQHLDAVNQTWLQSGCWDLSFWCSDRLLLQTSIKQRLRGFKAASGPTESRGSGSWWVLERWWCAASAGGYFPLWAHRWQTAGMSETDSRLTPPKNHPGFGINSFMPTGQIRKFEAELQI